MSIILLIYCLAHSQFTEKQIYHHYCDQLIHANIWYIKFASPTSLLIVLFLYQYALNIEQFDVAKQLREKLTEVT